MGAAGLQAVGQVDHLFDGLEIPGEENDTARPVFLDE
jgi:hypothetical protein